MGKRITYFTGAGASANALPTYFDFDKRIKIFYDFLQQYLPNSEEELERAILESRFPSYKNDYLKFKNDFFIFFNNSLDTISEFGSPDIVAKYLSHNDNDQLNEVNRKFKALLTIFLLFEQADKIEISKRLEIEFVSKYEGEFENNQTLREFFDKINSHIDNRYLSLIATYAEPNGKGYPNNINFITWNYDYQIELSIYKFFNGGGLNSINKQLNTGFDESQSNIVRLNGVGLFEEIEAFQNVTRIAFPYNLACNMFMKYFDALTGSSKNSLIEFGWEENKYSKIKKAKDILNKTDILIISGYSFPVFNRQTDKKLLYDFRQKIDEGSMKIIIHNSKDASDEIISTLSEFLEMDKKKFIPNIDLRKFPVPHNYF